MKNARCSISEASNNKAIHLNLLQNRLHVNFEFAKNDSIDNYIKISKGHVGTTRAAKIADFVRWKVKRKREG